MGWARFVAKQLRQPRGLFGRVVMAPLLNRGNERILSLCLEALDPESGDRVLDVGFGGGRAFEMLWERAPGARLLGIDTSRDMVRRAARVYRQEIRAKRLHVDEGDAQQLPYEDGSLDKVLTVNTVYFWPEPRAVFREIRRVLRPAGRVAVGFRSPESLARFKYTDYEFAKPTPDEVRSMILDAGFSSCRIEHYDATSALDSVVALAEA